MSPPLHYRMRPGALHVIDAETAYVDAQTEYNSALAELEQALGSPIE